MGFFDDDDFNDFFDLMEDIEMLDDMEREEFCEDKCPDYRSCRANFDKCKYKKKKGWFF